MSDKIQFLDLQDAAYPSKYGDLLEGIAHRPAATSVFVPFQDHPNLPGFKITPLDLDGRTLYHGLSSQSAKKDAPRFIPIFSSLDEVQPSYAKYFELISLPVAALLPLLTPDSSAKGFMLDMFSLNIILDDPWLESARAYLDEALKN